MTELSGTGALVTGGGSGLGRATAIALIEAGASVTIFDRNEEVGESTASDIGALFAAGDVSDPVAVGAAVERAAGVYPLRLLVQCAGYGGAVRLVERDGSPGDLERYKDIVNTNLIGTFNVLRLAAARMAANEPANGERGACVLTASVAAYEGQIGQIPYASAKAGIVGMTIVAARDLSRRLIRVNTIAPGTFDTPLLARLPDQVLATLADAVPMPSRLGDPSEYASLALHVLTNPMLNGETIRLDGAIRMPPR